MVMARCRRCRMDFHHDLGCTGPTFFTDARRRGGGSERDPYFDVGGRSSGNLLSSVSVAGQRDQTWIAISHGHRPLVEPRHPAGRHDLPLAGRGGEYYRFDRGACVDLHHRRADSSFADHRHPQRQFRGNRGEIRRLGRSLYEAKDWTNLSSESNAQAASMLGGQENTPAATQGLRVLRLATDGTDVGRVAQYLGTMDAGATYVFAADAFSSNDLPWSGTAAFVNEATATPGTVYATQTLDLGIGTTGVLTVSYTALPADAGNQLFIWLQSNTPSPTRGGIDNARLVGVLPSVPTGPSPADSAGTVSVASSLAWESTPGAIRYELFLWLDGGTRTYRADRRGLGSRLESPDRSSGTDNLPLAGRGGER